MSRLYSVGVQARITRACAAVAGSVPEDRARLVSDAAEEHAALGRGFEALRRLVDAAVSAGMSPAGATLAVQNGWRQGLKRVRKPKQGELL